MRSFARTRATTGCSWRSCARRVGVTHELRRMNNYGVLGRYIPAFGRVVGRMQYDLFHAYTVDAHTLFVVSNLRRLAIPRVRPRAADWSRRSCSSCPKPEIAYLAALFHDIAKGRGGDHSELGAVDAEAFCLEQGLSRYDARLVAWLVRNHLQLSITAQKQDIGDPQVINAFARKVGDETHLDYLYVLTCADVRGTNPKLWNSWKASLFHEFYERVKRALRRGLESPIDQEELVRETQDAARRAAARARHRCGGHRARLGALPDRVFPAAHARGDRLAHARCSPSATPAPMSRWSSVEPRSERGTTAVLIFAPHAPSWLRAHHRGARSARAEHRRCAHHPDRRWLLARLCITCSRTTARRSPTRTGAGRDRAGAVALAAAARRCAVCGLAPRAAPGAHVQHARRTSRISVDERNRRSVLELTAGDRPGLLCDVGKVLMAGAHRAARRQDHDRGRARRGRVLPHRF